MAGTLSMDFQCRFELAAAFPFEPSSSISHVKVKPDSERIEEY